MEGNVWGPICGDCGSNCSCSWNYGKCPMKKVDLDALYQTLHVHELALANVSNQLTATWVNIEEGDKFKVCASVQRRDAKAAMQRHQQPAIHTTGAALWQYCAWGSTLALRLHSTCLAPPLRLAPLLHSVAIAPPTLMVLGGSAKQDGRKGRALGGSCLALERLSSCLLVFLSPVSCLLVSCRLSPVFLSPVFMPPHVHAAPVYCHPCLGTPSTRLVHTRCTRLLVPSV